jgi:hypothetical protein
MGRVPRIPLSYGQSLFVEAVGDLGVATLGRALRPICCRVRRRGGDIVRELGFDAD